MRSTASIVLLPLLTALCLPLSNAQNPRQAPGQVVLEKVATNGMLVQDTQFTLNGLELRAPYFLEGGTVAFWGASKHGWRLGVFSAKDGQIKTVSMTGFKVTPLYTERIPLPFDFVDPTFGSNGRFNTDFKAGGGLLYITLRFGVISQKTRSVCAWDGDKLRSVLWRGESAPWLSGETIKAAEVVAINPDGSAMIVYETEGGQYGLATHSKALGLRPLLSTASPLPGMPGVTILKDTFEPLFEQQAITVRKGFKRADWDAERDRSFRWRFAPPALLGDWLFLVVEPAGGHPFLARIGGGKTERIMEEGSADPTDPGFFAKELRSFKAVTPGMVAVEIADAKYARRLLVYDQGKFSLVYQSTGAFGSVAGKQGYSDAQGIEDLQPLQVVSAESKSFCALAEERFNKGYWEFATQVRCFDGVRMSNVTGRALIGAGNIMRAIPGLPGVLVIDAQFTPTGRHAVTQVSQWVVNGKAAGQELQPAPEIFSSGGSKYTLGDVIGVDPATKTVWLKLADGFYKAHGAGD